MLNCGKQSYPSRGAAIRAALSYSKKRGVGLRVYKHSCGAFHLTSKPIDNGNREGVK